MKKLIHSAIVFWVFLVPAQLMAQGYQLDPSFDGDGIKVINHAAFNMFGEYVNTFDEAFCVALDANDKILVGGYTGTATVRDNFVVYRFNEDGTADNAFGTDGKTIVNVDTKGGAATSIKIMPDGKILVAGYAINNDKLKQLVLVRLNGNGTLDTSFGTNGFSKTNLVASSSDNIKIFDILISSDGNIHITAFVSSYGYYVFNYARFDSNGIADITLGDEGLYRSDYNVQAYSSVMDNNGNIVVAGFQDERNGVFRIKEDGSLDSTFSLNGVGGCGNCYPRGILNMSSKLTLVGYNTSGTSPYDGLIGYKLTKFNQNGSVDDQFGSNGILNVEYYVNGAPPRLNNIKSINNKIILFGYARWGNFGNYTGTCATANCFVVPNESSSDDFWVLMLNEDGSVDNSFGNSGTHIIPVSTQLDDEVIDVTMDSKGRVIAVGYVNSGPPYYRDIAITRLADITTGIDAKDSKSKISVYPNPGKGVFKLNSNGQINPSEIRIINSQGIEVNTMTIQLQEEIKIDLSNQPLGMYLIDMVVGNEIQRVKLIKE